MARERYTPARGTARSSPTGQPVEAREGPSPTPASSSTSPTPASSSASPTPASSSASPTAASSSASPTPASSSASPTPLTEHAQRVIDIGALESMGEAVLLGALQGVIDGVAGLYAFDDEQIGGILLQLASNYDVSGS